MSTLCHIVYEPDAYPTLTFSQPFRLIYDCDYFYRAMHFSAYARSWDRMSSVRLSVCDVGGL